MSLNKIIYFATKQSPVKEENKLFYTQKFRLKVFHREFSSSKDEKDLCRNRLDI